VYCILSYLHSLDRILWNDFLLISFIVAVSNSPGSHLTARALTLTLLRVISTIGELVLKSSPLELDDNNAPRNLKKVGKKRHDATVANNSPRLSVCIHPSTLICLYLSYHVILVT
jgi:hypothetical protein